MVSAVPYIEPVLAEVREEAFPSPSWQHLEQHHCEEVHHLLAKYSDLALPTKIIRFDDWVLTVRLLPSRPDHISQGRVIPWSLDQSVEQALRHVHAKIRLKQRHYGPTADPLVLAVNVHALEFSPTDDGKQILFDSEGT